MDQVQLSASATSKRPTGQGELDRSVEDLRLGAVKFTRTSPSAKAALVRDCLALVRGLMADWSRLGLAAKRLPPNSAEEWFAGPAPVAGQLRALANSLDEIAVSGRPRMGTGVRERPDGRLEVRVVPANGFDRVLMSGASAWVLLRQGVDRNAALEAQAPLYQLADQEPAVALVLGAGNVSSLPVTDVLTQLFDRGRVCLLKLNPVNEWVGPILERALQPLIDVSALRVAYGGAEVGAYLSTHPGIDWVHITGSAVTHDRLLWGPPGEDHDRRARGELAPLLDVPVSAELGNITPVAIVPDTYGADELAFQARSVATMMTNNASFNCLSARMLVTATGWAQREAFLHLLLGFLAETPTRYAYYPGAADRHHAFTEGRSLRVAGDPGPDELPWTVVPGLDATDPDDPLFRFEPFCSLLAEVSVGGTDPLEFLQTATGFMNDVLWGTLCAGIVISPRLERDPAIAEELDRAIVELQYGNVGINAWPGLNFGQPTLPWGGHIDGAGRTPTQSGTGFVHNAHLLGAIDKGVLRSGITMRPTPAWFTDNPKGGRVAPVFTEVVAEPRWRLIPRLLARAL